MLTPLLALLSIGAAMAGDQDESISLYDPRNPRFDTSYAGRAFAALLDAIYDGMEQMPEIWDKQQHDLASWHRADECFNMLASVVDSYASNLRHNWTERYNDTFVDATTLMGLLGEYGPFATPMAKIVERYKSHDGPDSILIRGGVYDVLLDQVRLGCAAKEGLRLRDTLWVQENEMLESLLRGMWREIGRKLSRSRPPGTIRDLLIEAGRDVPQRSP